MLSDNHANTIPLILVGVATVYHNFCTFFVLVVEAGQNCIHYTFIHLRWKVGVVLYDITMCL